MWQKLRQWMTMSDDAASKPFPWADQWPEITDARVRAAFARVPRTAFIAPELERYAGQDAPLPIGEGQTISQPFVVALMVQMLALQPGARVLEVGTGSGYETAILCEMTRVADEPAGAAVYSIERYPSLAERSAQALAAQGYAPHLRVGDGAAGWPEAAPFDAIIVSAAAAHVPRPLCEQLADGGRMVLPVGEHEGDQDLWIVSKSHGRLHFERNGGVRFVPLVSPVLDDPAQWAEEF
ncbi:MAG: protein-L-isoaspartate(D-aspartate) O-methyltransferase [Caldilinea sp.]|nr:protein-L-isoaspartate(D-aspartate) O-methyltransferase [Caldilinea sp.]MCB0150841.1 protein-L-isoaspartate(D-aspartate) O-methyltransferase [Caldilineaceae bacterium]MCO5211086.1 protein-L-isoaspartate(D-aspartate) O-methyltransferase [Caldilinea sp.]MCW5842989.1 protein-L-isoaspartate(D-aspartate) O-methyltransferase [Caldilinea sp.]HRW49675.1 protein-L-isoaspartate(D-aspartate) O-methyltransferase [Caldilinea sp.]